MALKITKVDTWAVEIHDEPGGLAQVLAPLAEAGADLECIIARRQADKFRAGVVFLTPIKGKKVEAVARSIGLEPAEEMATLRVEGPDQPGSGLRMTQALADAGLNLRGVSSMSCGKSFVCYIGLDSREDAEKAIKALKGLSTSTASRNGKRRLARI